MRKSITCDALGKGAKTYREPCWSLGEFAASLGMATRQVSCALAADAHHGKAVPQPVFNHKSNVARSNHYKLSELRSWWTTRAEVAA